MFLWQESAFYNKARFARKAWHLRWFTFTPNTVYSVPDRAGSESHRMTYPKNFKHIEYDDRRLIIRIINPDERKRDYYFMAPSEDVFEEAVSHLQDIMEHNASDDGTVVTEQDPSMENISSTDTYESLIEFPEEGSSAATIFFFVVLFPIRFIMHLTLPDVRVVDGQGNIESSLMKAYCAVFMCLLWLIVGSYAMVSSLENLADLLAIPTAIVGVTVSAAGTSLPNYVASKIAAEEGFGNQAVSNAFGSNTFNIMVGLGLPWVLYTSFGTGFAPYHGLRDEGITASVLIMASVLAVFVVIVINSGFVLRRWHGILFIILYAVYIAYNVALVYVS